MPENKQPKKTKKASNPLVGAQAVPTVLGDTTKLDIDVSGTLIDNIIDAGLHSRLDTSAIEHFTSISNSRDQVYQLIDTMCQDSTISAIVRTYSEDVCETSDNGHIVWCESQDPKITKFVNYLLNVINVDKSIFKWTYCLIKYGDVYLRLYRESDYEDKLFSRSSIQNAADANGRTQLKEAIDESVNISFHSKSDPYSYYVEMVPDPGTMFELTRMGQTCGYIEVPNDANNIDMASYVGGDTGLTTGAGTTNFNYRYKSQDVNVYQADDFVHASLEDNISRFPETVDLFYSDMESTGSVKPLEQNAHRYTVKRGKSLLYDAYKVWREKALLESAVMLSRLTRSGIVRKVGVEVGDMPKAKVQEVLRRVKELFEQRSAFDTGHSFSEYTNPGAVENFIFYATHGGLGNITVESVGGDFDPKQLTDLDWWNNKLYSAFGIPKQYFGWTEDAAGFNGGSALTIISSVYSKGVKRIQNTMIQVVTDIINLILLNKGCKSYLNNFTIKMRPPVTQEEVSFRENFTNRVNAISNVNALFADVEDKAKRLTILKSLVSLLDLGDEVMTTIQKEIGAAAEAAAKAAEDEAAAAEAESQDLGAMPEEDTTEAADTELPPLESFGASNGGQPLLEDDSILNGLIVDEDVDLPTPAEADSSIDFSENN